MADGNDLVIAKSGNASLQTQVTTEVLKNYLTTFGLTTSLTENEQQQFLGMAQAHNLNPFKREIYCYASEGKHGRKLTIVTGFEVYIKRANLSGLLDGWKVETNGSLKDHNLSATLTVYRKDWKHSFEHTVFYSEYTKNNTFWNSKPATMIKKVAVGSGMRLCFPLELEGLPYLEEELNDDCLAESVPTRNDSPGKSDNPQGQIAKEVIAVEVEPDALELENQKKMVEGCISFLNEANDINDLSKRAKELQSKKLDAAAKKILNNAYLEKKRELAATGASTTSAKTDGMPIIQTAISFSDPAASNPVGPKDGAFDGLGSPV